MRIARIFLGKKAGILVMLAFSMPFQVLAQVTAEGHAEVAQEEGGLPQLNAEFYPSQVFWLLVTGILMYLVMSRIALPRVSRFLDARDDRVRHDLETAARLRQEAEDIKVIYSRSLRDADERSRALIDRVTREIKAKHTQDMADSMARLTVQIGETEHRLRDEKNAVLAQAPQIAETLGQAIINQLGEQAA